MRNFLHVTSINATLTTAITKMSSLHMSCRTLRQFTHTALNLAAGDALKQSKLMKDALERMRKIVTFFKYSPHRDGIFQRLKETVSMGSTPGVMVLCPTRWTVSAESIHNIIANYDALRRTWEEALQVTPDMETKARIQGVAAQITTFTCLGNIFM